MLSAAEKNPSKQTTEEAATPTAVITKPEHQETRARTVELLSPKKKLDKHVEDIKKTPPKCDRDAN